MLAFLFVLHSLVASGTSTLTITSQPADQTAFVGSGGWAVFRIEVSVNNVYTRYQWYYSDDGWVSRHPIEREISSALGVWPPNERSGRQYRCTAHNDAIDEGVTSDPATLTVIDAPAQAMLELVFSPNPPETPSGTIRGSTSGTGWAVRCGGSIVAYALLVDDTPVAATFTAGVSRPDVDSYFATHACPTISQQVGYTFTFDATTLTFGPHQLKVRVSDDRGLQTDSNAQPVNGSVVWTPAVTTLPASMFAIDAEGADSTIFAVGGATDDTSCSNLTTLRAFDTGTGAWGGPILLPTPLGQVAKLAVLNDVLYVVGNTSRCSATNQVGIVQGYDIVSGTWANYATLPGAENVQGLGVIDAQLYAVERTAAYKFDPIANAWTPIAAPPAIPFSGWPQDGSVSVLGGLLYLVGGGLDTVSGAVGVNRVVAYNPADNTWSDKATLSIERYRADAAALGGRLYAITGLRATNGGTLTFTPSVEAYDPAANQWTRVADAPVARAQFGTAVVNGAIYAVGGYTDAGSSMTTLVTQVDAMTLATRPRMAIDAPAPSEDNPELGHLNLWVKPRFTVCGWAVDLEAVTGTGIDDVQVWAYPTSGGTSTFLGAPPFEARTDIAAAFGRQFTNSGFSLTVTTLAPGRYDLVVYARSTVTGTYQWRVKRIGVDAPRSNPLMAVDAPTPGSVSQPFGVSGWAADFGAPAGTGVDAVHVWAAPVSGGVAILLGAAELGYPRPDIGGQFTNSGFSLSVSTLDPGTYDLVVFAHSTVSGTFNQWRVVRITVP